MKIQVKTPQLSLSKDLLRFRPSESAFAHFKIKLSEFQQRIDNNEREDQQKTYVQNFFRDTAFPANLHDVNSKGTIDLAIFLGPTSASRVGVIVEAKAPGNKAQMVSADRPNVKALHELVLYFMRERVDEGNDDLKYLVATNINEWFIFAASDFNKLFYDNAKFRKTYEEWRDNLKVSANTDHFYDEIVKPFIDGLDATLDCTHFDLRTYDGKTGERRLVALYKVLSPHFLLKKPFADDSNTLNKAFYTELLHVIGLEEYKEKSKTLIRRKQTDNTGSLLEMAITMLDTKDVLTRIDNVGQYGSTREERLESIALELCITWINRILFLKLLEAQLVNYHEGDSSYRFLSLGNIRDFDELFALFHQVLAKTPDERKAEIREKFARVPYLNSSLFEISALEEKAITIESLKDHEFLRVIPRSILRTLGEKAEELKTLEYLFRFLDAYDFASEGKEEIQKEKRELINASVLGKVFEKINGYKDGSIYTPGFITMYMCRQAIRLAVVQKFRDETGFDGADFDELQNWIGDRNTTKENILRFNAVIDSLKICDPAVGSGHFLVSALNEILTIKSKLKIFADADGKRFGEYSIDISNDELVITDRENNLFEYKIRDGKPLIDEMQRLQSALFHEKQKLIENCLFGVDINPNSVKICRLRLWIELLKNAYYNGTALETLPNIDINIKNGNSLISRFALEDSFKSKETNRLVAEYREAVAESKNVKQRERKDELKLLVRNLQKALASSLEDETKAIKEKLDKKYARLNHYLHPTLDFARMSEAELEMKTLVVTREIAKVEAELAKVEKKYVGAFEWRFEFPEVLDAEGNFLGFDVVTGNPPYIRQESLGTLKKYLEKSYKVYSGTADILVYFYEVGIRILKPNGRFSFITANKFMRASFGSALRTFLGNFSVSEVIDFADAPVFGGIAAYASIVNLQKREPAEGYETRVYTFPREGNVSDFEASYKADSFTIPQSELTSDGWRLERTDHLDLLSNLRNKGKPLGKYIDDKIYYGIKTGLNEAFVVDRETRDKLLAADASSADIIVPFLRGRDVKRWTVNFEEIYLIRIESSGNKKHAWTGLKDERAEAVFAQAYPAVHAHLQPFRKKLQKRDDKGVYYWELRACVYWGEFDKPKIIYPNITERNLFAWDENGFLTNQKAFIIPTDDKFLLGYLNSSTVFWLFDKMMSKLLGGFFEPSAIYMEKIPIPCISEGKRVQFTALVDQILELKKSGGDTSGLENQIDEMVYDLYDLTEEEKDIVRNSV